MDGFVKCRQPEALNSEKAGVLKGSQCCSWSKIRKSLLFSLSVLNSLFFNTWKICYSYASLYVPYHVLQFAKYLKKNYKHKLQSWAKKWSFFIFFLNATKDGVCEIGYYTVRSRQAPNWALQKIYEKKYLSSCVVDPSMKFEQLLEEAWLLV